MASDVAILAIIVPPFIAAILASLSCSTCRRLPWIVTLLSAIISLVMLLVAANHCPALSLNIAGLELSLQVDRLGFILGLVTLVNGILILMYSLGYVSPHNAEHPVHEGYPRYYAIFSLFIGAMLGVALSHDLVSFTLFYELTGICSCLLIGFYREEEHTYNGYTALVLTHIGGVCLLIAAGLLYSWTGSVLFSALRALSYTDRLLLGLLFLIAGLAKSAQLPFHHWLPRAMVAPTTVSAYLHAASMVNVGVFSVMRFAEYANTANLPLGSLLLALSLATMFYGAAMYYAQRDLKRLLAYSTIVQLGYMMLGVSFTLITGSFAGLEASLYHMWNHSFAKALLFLSVGAIAYSLGTREVDALRGLSSRLPLTAFAWGIGVAALCGVPPLNCFYSKLAVITAGLQGNIVTEVGAYAAIAEFILTFIAFITTIPLLIAHEPRRDIKSKPTLSMYASLVLLGILVFASPYVYKPILNLAGW